MLPCCSFGSKLGALHIPGLLCMPSESQHVSVSANRLWHLKSHLTRNSGPPLTLLLKEFIQEQRICDEETLLNASGS